MASRKILVQLDIAAASDLTSPSSGFVGFSAKADGLYQKIGTAPELRLLTSADVQNAILADGSITGAVSQAQIFTMGVKLYNLTQGYVPYASGATKLLSNSPIYTDGTNVGIGTTDPGAKLDVNGKLNILSTGTAGNLNVGGVSILGSSIDPGESRILYITDDTKLVISSDKLFNNNPGSEIGFSGRYRSDAPYQLIFGSIGAFKSNINDFDPTGFLSFKTNDGGLAERMRITSTGNVGIGTTNPGAKLSVVSGTNGTLNYPSGNWAAQIYNQNDAPTSGGLVVGNRWADNSSIVINIGSLYGDGTTWRSFFTVKGGGNVGIGTIDPKTKAHIYGTLTVDPNGISNSFSEGIRIGNASNGYSIVNFGADASSATGPQSNQWWIGKDGRDNGFNIWGDSTNDIFHILSSGNVGIGTTSPTASLHIKAGTATTGTAPIKLTSGVNLTTPESGAIEFSSLRLYFTPSSTRETIAFLSDITSASHAAVTIGAIGSVPNANGMSISGQTLSLQPASALYGGVVTTGTQTLAGAKTLSSLLTASAGIANSDSYIQTGTSENTFTGITNINNAISYNYRNFTYGGTSNDGAGRWSKLVTFQTTGQYNNDKYEILLRSRNYAGKLYVVINSNSNVTTNLVDFRFISDFICENVPDIQIYRSQDSSYLSTWDVYIYNTSYSSYEYAENNTRSHNGGGNGKVVTFYQNTYEDPPVGSIAVSYGPYFNGIVSATGITSSGTINFSSLTASKVVFTDGSKNLTSTGIGTASQFIKGDGSLDSNTYLTTGTAIISGSGVDGRITFWNGTNSLSSSAYLTWDDTNNRINTNFINLMYGFKLGTSTTAGYVLTTDANGNGTWQAPQGGGNIVSSVFGRTGTVVAVNGDYNTSQVTENTNLYFTDSRARVAISLTINGQSGASTYNNSTGILNVPNYSLTGLGGVPKTRTITINGEVQDLSANRTWNVGDLLSTGSYSNPSWLTSLAWSKITNKPTTFYGYGITETPWTSYLPLSGGTLTGDLNSKRIICQSIIGDDYNTGAIEILGSYDNTFYPTLGFDQPSNFAASIQLRGAIDFRLYAQGGTTYANLTTNKLISASLQIGTSTTSGYVLTADANGNGTWQAPGGSITGSGVDGRLTFWSGTNSLSSTSNLEWNSTTKNLGVTGGVVANGISSISVSTNSLLTNSFSLIATTTAGYVLTADAYGNGTWQAPTGSLSGFVPYTGATQDVNIGTFGIAAGYAFIGGLQLFNNYIQENEVGIHYNDVYALAAFDTLNLIYSYGSNKLRISDSGDVSIDKSLTIGNTNTSSYTDGGYLSVQTPSASYASFDFYSKDTFDDFGIVQIIANPEEGIILRARSNDNSSSSTLEIRNYDFSFYTNSLKRLEIAQNGSINAFGNTITSTGGFIGNASTATKLQTARTITIGNQSLSFDGTANLTYSLANIGVPTGSGVDGRITFWSGTNSLSSNSNLTWDNTNSRLTVYSIFSVGSFKLGTNATAGYVLTTDANGNGTWQAPPTGGGGSYTLPTASASVLGCVKIGSGITISSGVISVSTNYEAPLTFSSGLTRSGNAISVTSGTYVPFVGADRDVNLASYSIYAYDFLVYSDINLKCNIEDIKMKKLDINYKQFEYKTSRGEKRYGVIAQELLSIAPEFVSESNNSYAVKYTDLLIYEVAQLKEEVKQLKSLLCR